MPPRPTSADPTNEPSAGRVVRCERVEAGARAVLIRVTLDVGDVPGADAAAATLVAADRGHVLRSAALPGPAPANGSTVTLGFAATTTATPLGLWLGHRWVALPEPDDALRAAERELRAARARLEVSRSARALAELERDEALRAAARAEAAAHDASARAEALEHSVGAANARAEAPPRRAPAANARAETPPRRAPAANARAETPPRRAPAPARVARRRSWRAAGAAGGLGCAALVVTVLALPAGDGDAVRGVGDVAAASAEAVATRPSAARADDRLAARLKIPTEYFALYRRAASRYGLDWARLAAIGAIESGHGQAPVAGILAGANLDGASGPAQFLPGTWERFGLDGNADGRRNPYDPADAIPAMASYLRASGAPQDWRAALRSYNHSDAYVSSVEALAARLRADAT